MELTREIIGRQLHLLRIKDTNISKKQLSEILEITPNDVVIYEYGHEEIPKELYEKWLNIVLIK